MSRINHQDIRIGTLASLTDKTADYIKNILPNGFESFELTMGSPVSKYDFEELSKAILDVLGDKAVISSVGLYSNPLQDEGCAKDWETVIKSAKLFNTDLVCGFAGALEDRPVNENMPKFKEVFGPLSKLAKDEGVRIAFENCEMGGSWNLPKYNIAHSPRAWEMMFNEVPEDNLGLEWEPCHQMYSLIDPIPQLRKWAKKIFHVHGKDATVNWDVIKTEGIRSGNNIVWHRTPGFGDSNWTDIITLLRINDFKGSIDIEGWHDLVYRDELEITGQVHALNYLKECRGGAFVANPNL